MCHIHVPLCFIFPWRKKATNLELVVNVKQRYDMIIYHLWSALFFCFQFSIYNSIRNPNNEMSVLYFNEWHMNICRLLLEYVIIINRSYYSEFTNHDILVHGWLSTSHTEISQTVKGYYIPLNQYINWLVWFVNFYFPLS